MSHAKHPDQRMISYAQNFEDVILARLFKGQHKGFYVDIGACHPVNDSVTNHFYQIGWRGINVEPQPRLHAELLEQRPHDQNLRLCIGGEKSQRTLHITRDLGTSTLDPFLANAYQEENRISSTCQVDLITLNELWSDFVKQQPVDFLKIDVEGLEHEILRSADFKQVTPTILIIESIEPRTQKDNHAKWVQYLIAHYREIYFDGLNRFFVRKGHPLDRVDPCLPPNLFDNFISYREQCVSDELSKASSAYQSSLAALKSKDEALLHSKDAYEALATRSEHLTQELSKASIAHQAAEDALISKEADLLRGKEAYDAMVLREQHLINELINANQAYLAVMDALKSKDKALQQSKDAYESLANREERLSQELSKASIAYQAAVDALKNKDEALKHCTKAHDEVATMLEKKQEEIAQLKAQFKPHTTD